MTDENIAHVLVVDDSAEDRATWARFLTQDSPGLWQVREAESHADALAQIRIRALDAVLLDYALPGVDGIQLTRDILAERPWMPIVMLTGVGDEALAVEELKAGAQDYLSKGAVTAPALSRALRNAIARAGSERARALQDDALRHFAQTISHDIKGPVRQVHMLCDLLEKDLRSGDLSSVDRLLALIKQSTNGANRLMDALSAYCRAESPQAPSIEAVPVDRVIAAAIAGVSDLVAARDATIAVSDMPWVQGDEAFLVQLFQNLLENAIKYCPDRQPCIAVSCSSTDRQTTFAVADNGMGIPPEDIGAIFRPFRRLDGVVDIEGAGIGLATCWRIVQLHGGTLWCESECGRGSVFRFTLANATAPAAAALPVAAPTDAAPGGPLVGH